MLRFLLIVGLLTYVIYKVGSFLFPVGGSQRFQDGRRPNVNSNGTKREGKIKGGDYVDYEEVK